MSKTRKSELLVVLVMAAAVASAPPHQCEPEPTPNCSLVFPSILFLNPCQYVCFERLLLPSITVRKHNDGTLCTPAFGFLGIGTCHNGTCVQPESRSQTNGQPAARTPRGGTFRPRQLTPSEHPQPTTTVTTTVGHADHPKAAATLKPAAVTDRPAHRMP
ncbi:hypothetical protein HPB49_017022 [Dermacentor silvarum]|uniref:Uncharacterized protein n=1 Tax=Dermacentor silvarum TaxID=543639 RepID=A0ACB8D6N6_DERSI|nr:hypothetical protein HPB49_017022 [Dermacentor silvarum]